MDMKHLPENIVDDRGTLARREAGLPATRTQLARWSRSSCMHSTKSPSRVSRCSPTMGSFPRRTNSARSSW